MLCFSPWCHPHSWLHFGMVTMRSHQCCSRNERRWILYPYSYRCSWKSGMWPSIKMFYICILQCALKWGTLSGGHSWSYYTDVRSCSQVSGTNLTMGSSHRKSKILHTYIITRTTRMPVFWGYPPPPHDYSHYWVILDPKSKEDKVKVTNLNNLPKFQIVEFSNKLYTWHTFWSCLIRCAKMKWIQWVLLKIQSGHDSVHRRTDRQTDKVKPVYPPFNFFEAEGIIIIYLNQA